MNAEAIYENPPEGFLISDEYNRNYPNSDTYQDSIGSAQEAEGNRDAEDAAERINYDESVASINEDG